VYDSNQKKTSKAEFLNSDEQTEQNFRRVTTERNYVPKTDYSSFVENQTHETQNTKKREVGLFKKFNHGFRGCGEGAKSGKRTEGQWIIQ